MDTTGIKKAIEIYSEKIRESGMTYNFFDFDMILPDIKSEFTKKLFFVEKKEKTDVSLFEKEFGYKLPGDIAEYLNSYYHPGVFGFNKFYECICLNAVIRYEGEDENDLLYNCSGLIKHMKDWRDIYGGDIKSYIPIGSLISPESYVLYEVKTGRIFLEDTDNDGKPEKIPFEESLENLILSLEPIKPDYIDLKFELEDSNDSIFNENDFEYVRYIKGDYHYHVLANGRPWLDVVVPEKNLFDTAIVYSHYLLIGSYDKVYVIDLWELNPRDIKVQIIDVDMYFGSFVTLEDTCFDSLFILDATGIIAFNPHMSEMWRNHDLAIDGVTFVGIEDYKMQISCEMDPPNGWVDKKINVWTGEVI